MSGISTLPDIVANQTNKGFMHSRQQRASDRYNGVGLKHGLHVDASLTVLGISAYCVVNLLMPSKKVR